MPTMTGLDQVADAAEQARAARAAYRAAMTELRQTITAADRGGGTTRNQIAATAAPGMSRDLVYKTLGVADLESDVRRALQDVDALVSHHANGQIHVELADAALDMPEVDRLNWASAISGNLRDAGLALAGGFEDLARPTASIQVVRQDNS